MLLVLVGKSGGIEKAAARVVDVVKTLLGEMR